MADKLISEMNPKEQEELLRQRATASEKRAAEGSNLTATQPNIEEQKELDKAGQNWMDQIKAATPPKSSTPESTVIQRAQPGGEAYKQMGEMYGGRLSTTQKPPSENLPVTNPSELVKPAQQIQNDSLFAKFKRLLGRK